MKFFHWIEDQLDKITPKVEVSGRSKNAFTKESFASLMNQIESEFQLVKRSESDSVRIFCFTGNTLGNLSQVKAIFAREANSEMYGNMKSRYRFVMSDDGGIDITSYEHMAGLKKERRAFESILSNRLNLALGFINQNGDTQNQNGDAQ